MMPFRLYILMLIFGIEKLIPCWCLTQPQQTSNGDQSTNPQVLSQLSDLKNALNAFCEEVLRQMKINEARLVSIMTEVGAAIESYESDSIHTLPNIKPQYFETSQPNILPSLRPQSDFQNVAENSAISSQTSSQHRYNTQLQSILGNQIENSNQYLLNAQQQSSLGNQPQILNQNSYNIPQPSTFGYQQPYSTQQTQNLGHQPILNHMPNKNQYLGANGNGQSASQFLSYTPRFPSAVFNSYQPPFTYYAPTNTLLGQHYAIHQPTLSAQPTLNYPQFPYFQKFVRRR